MLRKLADFKQQAPQLCKEHLQDCIDKAKTVDDKERVNAIIKLIKRESQRSQYTRLVCAFGKHRGNAAHMVAFHAKSGPDPVYKKHDDVKSNTTRHLCKRFSEARTLPFCLGQLLSNIGFIGDRPAMELILEGTYDFPEDCNKNAIRLMKEAARPYTKMANNAVDTGVTSQTFWDWWTRSDENIQVRMSLCAPHGDGGTQMDGCSPHCEDQPGAGNGRAVGPMGTCPDLPLGKGVREHLR